MDALDRLGYQPDDLFTFVLIERNGISFYIAKYPVTNLQYERFLRRENFEDESLWTGFPGFSEPDENGHIREIGDWGEEGWNWLKRKVENGLLYPRYWRQARFGAPRRTAPVVCISWYEANAYCKWLLKYWDSLEEGRQGLPKPHVIRLPTEAEWVQAAGGKQDGRYAWGVLKNKKDIVRFANTGESGIGCTTPVWMYPQGASPLGVLDMSGNVWEWMANFRDKDHDVLAVRGGSWYLDQGYARVSIRKFDLPVNGYDNIGFRVAAFPR
jgi:formylglycine-generating enzyme required for sulfatase activity